MDKNNQSETPLQKCSNCGAPVRPDSPEQLCPACLLANVINPAAETWPGGDVSAETCHAGEALKAPSDEFSTERIGRYKLLQKIGEGGCGVVYMAEQEEPVRRRVALKVIKLGMDTKQVIARFEAERQALAMMDHPNIAKVFDAGATETGRPYFVMELVKGIRITDYCDQNNLSTRERLGLFKQVCHAIQHAHQKGIIHRDIKPSNILVTLHDGVPVPKVIDFGIAKATDQQLTDKTVFTAFGQFIGTPAYMSPEQAELSGLDIDTRTDIYSLGVLLYELLTGSTPFDVSELLKRGLDEMRRTVREMEPPRPSTKLSTLTDADLIAIAKARSTDSLKLSKQLRGDLDWVVMKCLEKDRTRRYETVSAVGSDIARHLNNDPVTAAAPSALYRFGKFARRNKSALAAASAIVVALCAGVVVSRLEAVRARRESDRAQRAVTRLELERAESFLQASDSSRGLAYLARLLREQPTNRVAADRLMSVLTLRSFCVPIAPLQHGRPANTLTPERRQKVANRFAFRPSGSVAAANFSPDGTRVVTASQDGTARLWAAVDGKALGEMKHEGEVLWAQFSPDGEKIVTASADGSARLWSAHAGQALAGPLRHDEIVHFASFSPDGEMVITASRDHTVRTWNARTAGIVGEPLHHSAAVYFACLSADGRLILTADEANRAHVWDAKSRNEIAAAEHFHFPQFPSPFPQFGTTSEQIFTLKWHEAVLRSPRLGLTADARLRHESYVTSATFSPDGGLLATVSADATVRLWHTENGEAFALPIRHDAEVLAACFGTDGQQLLTGSRDRSARLWEVCTGQPLAEPMRQEEAVLSARLAPGGQRAATVSEKDAAWLWDVRAGQPGTVVRWYDSSPKLARLSPNGGKLLVLDSTDVVRVVDVASGMLQTKPIKPAATYTMSDVQFSPDGRWFATSSEDGTARVWTTSGAEPVTEPLRHKKRVTQARFSPDGKQLATSSEDHTARLWNIASGEMRMEFRHNGYIHEINFSPDGNLVITGSSDHTAQIWDAATGRPKGGSLKHDDSVYCATFDSTGRRVATASKDKSVRIWSVETGKMLTAPLLHADALHNRDSVTFSPNGTRLATVAGNVAQIWNPATGRATTVTLRHGGLVRGAEFSPDGTRLLTASEDGTARLWDTETGLPISEPLRHGGRVYSAEFSRDGSRVATCSSDKGLRIWEVTSPPLPVPGWLPALAESLAGQQIDAQEMTAVVPVEELHQLRQRLASNADNTYYGRWARWFFADGATRPISPSSDVTVPEYIQRRIAENTPESLQEATRLAPTNALAFARLAQLLIAPTRTANDSGLRNADWFSRYATNLSPTDSEIRLTRESVSRRLLRSQ